MMKKKSDVFYIYQQIKLKHCSCDLIIYFFIVCGILSNQFKKISIASCNILCFLLVLQLLRFEFVYKIKNGLGLFLFKIKLFRLSTLKTEMCGHCCPTYYFLPTSFVCQINHNILFFFSFLFQYLHQNQ